MGLFNKKELAKIALLEKENSILQEGLNKYGAMNAVEIENRIQELRIEEAVTIDVLKKDKENIISVMNKEKEKITNDLTKIKSKLEVQIRELRTEIESSKKKLLSYQIDLESADFGLYKPQYDFMHSDDYAYRITLIRDKQKSLISSKKALSYSDNWTLDGNKSKGRAMNNDNMKIYLRAFNYECDNIISKVKYNNYDVIYARILKSASSLDKLNVRNKISITNEYLDLKLLELSLVHEYNVKKQEEKEILREQRALEREARQVEKELEEARKVINKERTHYQQARDNLINQMKINNNDEFKNKLSEIDAKLDEIDVKIKDLDYREANQRAGYVYVISNIGSFGEGVYKIGMTRRLEPFDRIYELSGAAVPFNFDVHAMIFSDDAPTLEKSLHHAFENQKINLVNGRKEFFRASLDEIEKVVKENHDKLIEFVKYPDAPHYRESLKIKELMDLNME